MYYFDYVCVCVCVSLCVCVCVCAVVPCDNTHTHTRGGGNDHYLLLAESEIMVKKSGAFLILQIVFGVFTGLSSGLWAWRFQGWSVKCRLMFVAVCFCKWM